MAKITAERQKKDRCFRPSNTVVSDLLSKDEGLKDIGHNLSIGNLILVVNSVTVSYLICYNSLLQNAADVISNCGSYFVTKCDRSLLQNVSVFLLQNAAVLLQNATVITNCDNFITKCDSYYKMRRLLQIAAVHLELFTFPSFDQIKVKLLNWNFCNVS